MVPSITKKLAELQHEVESINRIALSVDCVIFGFEDGKLKVLLIRSDLVKYKNKLTLLGDLVSPQEDLEEAAYRILKQRTGLTDVFLEQVHTFGSVGRHPVGRVISVAYYSLINIKNHRLRITDNELHWHDLKSAMDLAFDHDLILNTCFKQLQKRSLEHPLALKLLPEKFSLRNLQTLYEAILNMPLDRRNFRKKFFAMNLLTDTGEIEQGVSHRPGKLYKFNYTKYNKQLKSFGNIDF